MFGHDWQRAEATIIERRPLRRSTSGDGLTNDLEVVAEVHPASGDAFRATVKSPLPAVNFWPPEIGETVSVLFDSKHNVKFHKDDPRTDVKARRAARSARFDDAANGTPQSQPGSPFAATNPARTDIASLLSAGARGANLDAIRAAAMRAIAGGTAVNFSGRPASAPEDPAARLAKLESLKQQGLMTDDEYTAARQHIIDAI